MALIESLALEEIPARLASFLLHSLSQQQEGVKQLDMSITQRELAKILGATPEALSRALRKMADERVLRTSGRTIHILNRNALENLTEGE